MRIPHRKNVPGDFYVEYGCCTACDAPQAAAGELFEFDDNHCYVCKQPAAAHDLARMADAMTLQELDCIRFRGNDVKVITWLKQQGLEE